MYKILDPNWNKDNPFSNIGVSLPEIELSHFLSNIEENLEQLLRKAVHSQAGIKT